MITHDELIQGSPEWRQYRLQHFGASEAAAMLGLSTRMKRNELLHMKATGTPREFSDWVQERVLDRGHEVEALARPHVEAMIGEDLYQQTVSDGRLSASTDGLTLGDDIAWEHKLWNDALAESVRAGIIPDEHMPQCQQVLMLTRAKKLIFTVSDGTPERMLHVEAKPDKDWFARLRTGWEQFAADLAAYKAPEVVEPVRANPLGNLPAVVINTTGALVVASNLAQMLPSAKAFVAKIPSKPSTDQEFVDCAEAVKRLKDCEDALDAAVANALNSVSDIEAMQRAAADLKEVLRPARLATEKLVVARKAQIRDEEIARGRRAVLEHVEALNARLGERYMPQMSCDFATAIKSLRTMDSLRNAIDTTIANFKISANETADRIQANMKALIAAGDSASFPDAAALVLKQPDDLAAVIAQRVAAERERIQARVDAAAAEAARKAEAAAKAEADRRAAVAPPPPPAAPAPAAAQTITASQDTQPPISTGEIGKRLGFILQVSFIEEVLGVTHSSQDKRAMLWRESDWPAIKAALVRHIGGLL